MDKALVVRHENCTGCLSCEMVCSLLHDGECNLTLSRIRVVKTNGGGTHENIAVVCQQCPNPRCAGVCDTNAISRDEETGILRVDEDLCVGCKACVTACPYGAALFHPVKDCAMKCDLCGGDPECVKSCTYGVLAYLAMDQRGKEQQRRSAERMKKTVNHTQRT